MAGVKTKKVVKNGKKVCVVCKKVALTKPRVVACETCQPERRRVQLMLAARAHRKAVKEGKATHYVARKNRLTKWARSNPAQAKKLVKKSSHPLAAPRLKLLEKVKGA